MIPPVAPAVTVSALGFALALMSTGAHAVLGETMALPSASRAQAAAAPRAALSVGVQVVERASGDGGMIREYVSAQGIVFAVAWNTRFKPKLDGLLGRYHAGYAAAASQALARPGRPGIQRQATLHAQDLIVQSNGFLNTFTGRAWVPSLVPAGFDPATIR